MTKLFFQFFLLFGLNQIAFSKNIGYSALKDGQFVLEDKPNGNTFKARTKTRQIEIQEYTKLKIEFEIKWTNDGT